MLLRALAVKISRPGPESRQCQKCWTAVSAGSLSNAPADPIASDPQPPPPPPPPHHHRCRTQALAPVYHISAGITGRLAGAPQRGCQHLPGAPSLPPPRGIPHLSWRGEGVRPPSSGRAAALALHAARADALRALSATGARGVHPSSAPRAPQLPSSAQDSTARQPAVAASLPSLPRRTAPTPRRHLRPLPAAPSPTAAAA
jgi:hypothetical protein